MGPLLYMRSMTETSLCGSWLYYYYYYYYYYY